MYKLQATTIYNADLAGRLAGALRRTSLTLRGADLLTALDYCTILTCDATVDTDFAAAMLSLTALLARHGVELIAPQA